MDLLNNSRELLEYIKKGISSVTIAVPFVYILGFIIINTHLSMYGVYDVDVVSVNYLKAGIFFVFILSFSIAGVLLVYTKNGEFQSTLRKHVMLLSLALLVGSTLTFVIFRVMSTIKTPWIKHDVPFVIGFNCYFLLIMLIILASIFRWDKLKRSIIFLLITIVCLLAFIFLCIRESSARWLILLFAYFTFSTAGIMEAIFKKEYRLTSLPFTFFNIITVCALFGFTVYDGIPPTYGGSKMKVKEILFKDSVIINSQKYLQLKNAQILYVSSDFYTIKLNDSVFVQIKKDNIQSTTLLHK